MITIPSKMDYYLGMIQNERAFVLLVDGKVKAFIGYFIGEKYDIHRFINKEPWSIVCDVPAGSYCYVDQLISDKGDGNNDISFKVWKTFKKHVLDKFSGVHTITWNRYKRGVVHVRSKSIRD